MPGGHALASLSAGASDLAKASASSDEASPGEASASSDEASPGEASLCDEQPSGDESKTKPRAHSVRQAKEHLSGCGPARTAARSVPCDEGSSVAQRPASRCVGVCRTRSGQQLGELWVSSEVGRAGSDASAAPAARLGIAFTRSVGASTVARPSAIRARVRAWSAARGRGRPKMATASAEGTERQGLPLVSAAGKGGGLVAESHAAQRAPRVRGDDDLPVTAGECRNRG
jgi:hypothetical protein